MSTWEDVVAMTQQLVDNEEIRAAGVSLMGLSRCENSQKTDKSRADFQARLYTARHDFIRVVLREARLKTSADQLVANNTVKEAMQPAYELGRRIKRLENKAPDEAEHEIADTHGLAIRGILWEAVQLGEQLPELKAATPVKDGDPGPASSAVVAPAPVIVSVQAGDPGPASGAVVAPAPVIVSVQAGDPGPASGAVVVAQAAPIKGILKNPDEDEPYMTPPDDAPRMKKIHFGEVQEQLLSKTTKKEDRLNARNEAKEARKPQEDSKNKASGKNRKAVDSVETSRPMRVRKTVLTDEIMHYEQVVQPPRPILTDVAVHYEHFVPAAQAAQVAPAAPAASADVFIDLSADD